jgi:hypothetical protein
MRQLFFVALSLVSLLPYPFHLISLEARLNKRPADTACAPSAQGHPLGMRYSIDDSDTDSSTDYFDAYEDPFEPNDIDNNNNTNNDINAITITITDNNNTDDNDTIPTATTSSPIPERTLFDTELAPYYTTTANEAAQQPLLLPRLTFQNNPVPDATRRPDPPLQRPDPPAHATPPFLFSTTITDTISAVTADPPSAALDSHTNTESEISAPPDTSSHQDSIITTARSINRQILAEIRHDIHRLASPPDEDTPMPDAPNQHEDTPMPDATQANPPLPPRRRATDPPTAPPTFLHDNTECPPATDMASHHHHQQFHVRLPNTVHRPLQPTWR